MNLKLTLCGMTYGGNQVEAMGNLGTTLKSLNRVEEARSYWLRALQWRPTYWDAIVSMVRLCLFADRFCLSIIMSFRII